MPDCAEYKLRVLPTFVDDMTKTVSYIKNDLGNEQAAERLVADTRAAIYRRLHDPLAFQPCPSHRERKYRYYRINIRNYSVFYIVRDGFMEVHRFLYGGMDIDKIL